MQKGNDAENIMDHNSSPNPIKIVTKLLKQYKHDLNFTIYHVTQMSATLKNVRYVSRYLYYEHLALSGKKMLL